MFITSLRQETADHVRYSKKQQTTANNVKKQQILSLAFSCIRLSFAAPPKGLIMDLHVLFSSHIFSYIVIPILIFLSRITDVSIGTMRLIFISKGYKLFAACLGFFEVLIWIVAITQIMKNLTNVYYYLAYAAGFATGNFVGMVIEEKIALGNVLLRVVTGIDLNELVDYMKRENFGFTLLEAEGAQGNVKIIFSILRRQDLDPILSFLREHYPNAFYTIEDIRYINEKHLHFRDAVTRNRKIRFFRRSQRKGK